MPQLKGPHIKLAGIELGIYYTIYILYTLQIGTVQTSMYYVVCTLLTIQAPNWAVYYTDGYVVCTKAAA